MRPLSNSDSTNKKPVRLAITPGEPAGIGPDIIIRLAERSQVANAVVFADPDQLLARANTLGVKLELAEIFDLAAPLPSGGENQLTVYPVALAEPDVCGQLATANVEGMLTALKVAAQACRAGNMHALVTGPVHKAGINRAGFKFSGHTEFLAEQLGADCPVMLLANAHLRVALVTTHLPLAAVPAAITRDHLRRVLEVLHRDLVHRFGIARPRIIVCGLNPHAGENGYLGSEDAEIIAPVIRELNTTGMHLVGPVPADTAFTPERLEAADAVLTMYHDQGLPVIKHSGFGETVNITLGLPIVRTSVDHGTALELAGTGLARPDSLFAAMTTARQLADHDLSVHPSQAENAG